MTVQSRRTWVRTLWKSALFGGLFGAAATAASVGFFEFGTPEQTCVTCHEIREPYERWAQSTHREVNCKVCHGGTLGALRENFTRLVGHLRDKYHDNMALNEDQVVAMNAVCQRCHAQEYAQWQASGHGVGYAAIFLDAKHNATEQVAGDCLRCHGMFFRGNVDDVVEPLDVKGPWQLKNAAMADRPVVPCLACHRVHVAGQPVGMAAPGTEAETSKVGPATATGHGSLYCRHERKHIAATDLPVPKIQDHGRPVQVSSDPRQRVCVQCHAPNAFGQAGSGDDRTPRGVHEGISCAACHRGHSNDARGSCVQCHPRLSHCGLDVETMDTTFHAPQSVHNIHSVRCADCHTSGVPEKKKKG